MFISDNAMSNDQQTTWLSQLLNNFESVNHIHCFNHTMQLSAKALLCPFTSSASTAGIDDSITHEALENDETDGMPGLDDLEEDEEADGDDNDDQSGRAVTPQAGNDGAEIDEEFNGLSDDEREQLLDGTAAVCSTLDKVHKFLHYLGQCY